MVARTQRRADTMVPAGSRWADRFGRIWQSYLAGALVAFRHDARLKYQIEPARSRHSLPVTRDYRAQTKRLTIAKAAGAPARTAK